VILAHHFVECPRTECLGKWSDSPKAFFETGVKE